MILHMSQTLSKQSKLIVGLVWRQKAIDGDDYLAVKTTSYLRVKIKRRPFEDFLDIVPNVSRVLLFSTAIENFNIIFFL